MLKNILIVGSYGAGNLGDEALLEVILKKLPSNTNKFVLSGNPEDTKNRHKVKAAAHLPFGLRSLFSFKWIKSFKILNNSDLVILGGGGLFTDDYTIKAVMLWAWHVFWFKIFGKKVVLFANSVGPLKTKLGQVLTGWAIGTCDQVIVRDQLSADCVNALLSNKKVEVGTDIVFAFDAPKEQQKKKLVALNLRDWNMDFSVFEGFVEYIQSQGYGVLLIPTEEADKKKLLPLVGNGVSIVSPQSFQELLGVLSTCEYALGMRLHFLIAAILSGSKVFGISYSQKVQGILDPLKIPFLSPENIDLNDLKKVFLEAVKVDSDSLKAERKKVEQMFEVFQ